MNYKRIENQCEVFKEGDLLTGEYSWNDKHKEVASMHTSKELCEYVGCSLRDFEDVLRSQGSPSRRAVLYRKGAE